MRQYVTHHFAHADTLARAERWLLQLGFKPGQIESHTEGIPWLSVLVAPERGEEARTVFSAAELTDPGGWPSFWELARMPHPHVPEGSVRHDVQPQPQTAGRSPIGWHPASDEGPASHRGEEDYFGTIVRFA